MPEPLDSCQDLKDNHETGITGSEIPIYDQHYSKAILLRCAGDQELMTICSSILMSFVSLESRTLMHSISVGGVDMLPHSAEAAKHEPCRAQHTLSGTAKTHKQH